MSVANGRPVPILLMVRELHLGGIEHDVTKIAIHIDRLRFEPYVGSYSAHGLRYDELRRANVSTLHLPLKSLMSSAAVIAARHLWSYVRQHKIRLVHAYDASAIFAVPLARIFRVPVVLSSQLGSRNLLDRRTHRQLRWTDRMVDAVVVNCEAMRSHLVSDESVPDARIELCYNGVDTREFFPLREPKPAPVTGASLVIGAICALRPEKALGVLQEAFARIRHLDPAMKLLIVGSGQELSRLGENSRRLGLASSCIFLPATQQVAKFLRAIDIFVSCSYSEAFSNSILEAMACGCCVVASRVGGTPELIEDGDRGLLFAAGNVDELAQKLQQVIQDAALRERLGKSATAFASSKLTIEKAAQRSMEIYETLLYRKSALE
jgi:glycosyltransferase involved in cell wall biosynthesis